MDRKSILIVAFISLFLVSCGGGDNPASPGDTTPPDVTSNNPVNTATDVSMNIAPSATFSEAIDITSINTSSFTLLDSVNNPVSGSVSYNSTTRTATFTPAAALTNNTTYTATISTTVTDLAGNAIATNHSWSFTTEATDNTPPSVSSNNPTDAATDVAVNITPSVVFSEAMDALTINTTSFSLVDGSSNPVSGTVSYNGGTNTATFTPDADLNNNMNYTATISTAVTDVAANPMAAVHNWSFTTIAANRPSNTTCLAGPPAAFSGATTTDAFPNLTFSQPLAMIPAPTGNMLYVIERGGIIREFDNNASVSSSNVFGNITSSVSTSGEGGLLGMAFDPNYASNGYVYLSYTAPNGGGIESRISRFQTSGSPATINSASEVPLITLPQPYTNHNGGQIAFDSNGHLFIGFGDGGSGNDPQLNGQNIETLFGAMLRIDPSTPDSVRGLPYSIPAGNPYAANTSCTGGCPEIYAYGIRNPWRWSFDRSTNQLWLGDVGQNNIEEIDLINAGENYGWGCYEGTRFNTGYLDGASCAGLIHTPPVHEYLRSDGNSVTGGYIYRGNDIPSLVGNYIFTDYGSGSVWSLSDPYTNPQRTTLFSLGGGTVSLAEDATGELYFINIFSSRILKLIPDTGSPSSPPFASQLSQTGCADSTDPKQATSGMIPYELNAPLWSDNASKARWLAIPDGTTIDINAAHDWDFPIGSVLRKDFYLSGRIIETRLLAHHSDGSWAGYSYEWNAAETEATLLNTGKTVLVNAQDWTYPSPGQCLTCHTNAAGVTLGPETAQFNMQIANPVNPSNQINQITYLDMIGMFTSSPASPSSLPALAQYSDPLAQPVDLARSYLHSNCSNCHRPGSLAPTSIDLRHDISFNNMNICDATPANGNVLGATRVLTPNNINDSIIYQRMLEAAEPTSQRMPPLGSVIEDPQGLQFVSDWITSLSVCP